MTLTIPVSRAASSVVFLGRGHSRHLFHDFRPDDILRCRSQRDATLFPLAVRLLILSIAMKTVGLCTGSFMCMKTRFECRANSVAPSRSSALILSPGHVSALLRVVYETDRLLLSPGCPFSTFLSLFPRHHPRVFSSADARAVLAFCRARNVSSLPQRGGMSAVSSNDQTVDSRVRATPNRQPRSVLLTVCGFAARTESGRR